MTTPEPPPLPSFRVEVHERLPSTQALLKERLRAGERVDGLVVRALEQRAGVGRRGKAWSAGPGGSYQSVALLDRSGLLRRPFTALAVAIGVAEELSRAGARVRVKWPNDVYLASGKVAGVLCDYLRGHLLVGVGANVNNELPPGAAALVGWPEGAVSEMVLEGVRAGVSELLLRPGGAHLRERYAALDLLFGQRVEVELPGRAGSSRERVSGVARGVNAAGALLLETGAGRREVAAGSVVAWGTGE